MEYSKKKEHSKQYKSADYSAFKNLAMIYDDDVNKHLKRLRSVKGRFVVNRKLTRDIKITSKLFNQSYNE